MRILDPADVPPAAIAIDDGNRWAEGQWTGLQPCHIGRYAFLVDDDENISWEKMIDMACLEEVDPDDESYA